MTKKMARRKKCYDDIIMMTFIKILDQISNVNSMKLFTVGRSFVHSILNNNIYHDQRQEKFPLFSGTVKMIAF